MAKYKAYPEYKDSGVEWLGVIPKYWDLKRAKNIFQRIQRPIRKTDGVVTAFRDGQVTLRTNRRTDGFTNSVKEIGYQGVRCNDLVIHAMDGFAGAIGVSDSDGKCSPVCSVCVPWRSNSINMRFYGYLVRQLAVTGFILSLAKGIRERSTEFRFNEFAGLMLALPSITEQDKISAFLDHETAKIDNLIEKQKLLIELLKEKRQAVISHAVTKGLNPDVPMKDSGVEWLGKVPEHWRVSRVKNFAKIESGHTPSKTKSEYWVNCIIPWVSLNDSKQLKDVDYIDDTTYKISELGMANSSAHLLPARAVVFTRDASIGLSAITTKPMAVSQHLIAWLCNERFVVPEFLLLVFYAMEKEFERYTFGATIKTIGMDNVRGLRSAFPPIDEQHKLIEWAFKKLEKIKFSINKVEDIISLLQERRTALISAAVTGKIDVRDWVAPDMQDAEEPQETTV